nr:hypothetical protein [Desulfobulbaceae bacterium]
MRGNYNGLPAMHGGCARPNCAGNKHRKQLYGAGPVVVDLPSRLEILGESFAKAFEKKGLIFAMILRPCLPRHIRVGSPEIFSMLDYIAQYVLYFTCSGVVVFDAAEESGCGNMSVVRFVFSTSTHGIPEPAAKKAFLLRKKTYP